VSTGQLFQPRCTRCSYFAFNVAVQRLKITLANTP
jgi:hypothetical protein